jgi:hypothetical protein
MMTFYTRRALILFVVAVVMRGVCFLVLGPEATINNVDGEDYYYAAQLMQSGWEWLFVPVADREPLYPLFMVVADVFPGPVMEPLQLLQVLLGAATTVGVYLGLRAVTRESVAFVAAMLVAISPHFWFMATVPMRENLVVLLLVGFVLTTIHTTQQFKLSKVFLSSLLYVLLIHTDTRYLPFMLVLPFMALVVNRSLRLTARLCGWSLLFVIILMIPYQIRNFVAFDKPVIITERVLESMIPKFRTRAESDANGRVAWLQQWEAQKKEHLDQLSRQEREYFLAGGRPAIGQLEVYWVQFLEYWRFMQLAPLYRPYPDGRFAQPWTLLHNISSAVIIVPFLVLLPFTWSRATALERRLLLAIFLFLAAHTFLHVVIHARERYRFHVEVFILTVVALSLVNLFSWFRERRSDEKRSPFGLPHGITSLVNKS